MKHVSILIPQGHTSVVNIEGSHQIMNEVNTLLAREGKPPLFKSSRYGKTRNEVHTPFNLKKYSIGLKLYLTALTTNSNAR